MDFIKTAIAGGLAGSIAAVCAITSYAGAQYGFEQNPASLLVLSGRIMILASIGLPGIASFLYGLGRNRPVTALASFAACGVGAALAFGSATLPISAVLPPALINDSPATAPAPRTP